MTVFINLQNKNRSLTDQQWSNFIKYLKKQSVTELCEQLNSLLHDFFTFMEQNNEKTIANNISKISNLYLGKILHYFNKVIIPGFQQKEPGDGHISLATAYLADFTSMQTFLNELLQIKKKLKKIGTGSNQFKHTSTVSPVPPPVPPVPPPPKLRGDKKVSFVQEPIVHKLQESSPLPPPPPPSATNTTQLPLPPPPSASVPIVNTPPPPPPPSASATNTTQLPPPPSASATNTTQPPLPPSASVPIVHTPQKPNPTLPPINTRLPVTLQQASVLTTSPPPSAKIPINTRPPDPLPLPLCPTPSSQVFGNLLIAALVVLFL